MKNKEYADKLFFEADRLWDKKDYKGAFDKFLEGANLGDSSCQHNLGYFYDTGLHVKKDKEKAIEWYMMAYRQTNSGAATNIGLIHAERGNWPKARWWLYRAVEMGDVESCIPIGDMYMKGRGVKINIKKALFLYAKAYHSGQTTEYSEEKLEAILKKHGRL